MTKVRIDAGVCGNLTVVEAVSEDGMTVKLHVNSACPVIKKMAEALGDEFDGYELCLAKPGANKLYEYAAENFKGHAACPTISGILKAVEVECKLALPKDATITFE